MSRPGSVLRRLRAAFARFAALRSAETDEARMAEEMRFHLDHLVEQYRHAGLSETEARRRAALAFGGVTLHQEAARTAMRALMPDQVAGEVRVALRRARRAPLATLSIVATLAVCIGATTAMFSILDAVVLRDLPFAEPSRLVWATSVRPDRIDAPFSLPEFMEMSERARGVELAGFTSWNPTFSAPSGAERLLGMRISARGFDILGARPAAGRLLAATDDTPGAARVVVLSEAFWRRRFGANPAVVGQSLVLNGESFTVAGVMPRHFPLPLRDLDVAVPLVPSQDPFRHVHGSTNFLRVFGRLRSGLDPAGAATELSALTGDLRARYPTEYAAKLGVRAIPLHDQLTGGARRPSFLMLGSVGLMLAIAFANVGNLLLIRATTRQGEVALQRALGASSSRIARGLVIEGALLAGAGGVLGSLLAWGAVSLIVRLGPLQVLRLEEARVDLAALLVALGLSLLGTALFSLLPLTALLRTDPQAALAASGRMKSGSRGQDRLRTAGVVVELALATLLVSGTVTMVGSLASLQRVDLGYRPDSVFVARLSLQPREYRDLASVVRFARTLHDGLAARPEVLAAGATTVAPLSGLLWSVPFTVVGGAEVDPHERTSANYRPVTADYFASIGATLATGRGIEATDDTASVPVAVVSAAFARRYIPGDPLGRQLLIDDNNAGPRPVTVIGVVADMRHVSIEDSAAADIYIPLTQVHRDGVRGVTNNQFWTVRVRGNPAAFGTAFLGVLRATDRGVATSSLATLREHVDAVLAPRRFGVGLLIGFAALSLLLATLGVYGVTAYGVELRRRDIALRLALGATPGGTVALVLRRSLAVVGLGVALGGLGALAGARVAQGLWFGVTPADPRVLGAVAFLLFAATLIAAWVPARRAARIDPMTALTAE